MARTTRSLISALVLAAGATVAHAQVVTTPVAISGGKALPSGSAKFAAFSVPVINNAGQVAFTAYMNGGGVNYTNDQALYVRSGSKLLLTARTGSPTARGSGVTYSMLGDVLVASASRVAFTAQVGGAGAQRTAVLTGTPGQVSILAGVGDAVPGAPGAVISEISALAMNAAGQVVISAGLSGTGVTYDSNRALLTGARAADLAMPVRSGTPMASLAGASFLNFGMPTINPSGAVVFNGFLDRSSPGVGDAGVFSVGGGAGAGGVQPLIQEGHRPAGAGGAYLFAFSEPSISAGAQPAYMAMLQGGASNWGNDLVIMHGDQVLARMGQPATSDTTMGPVGAPLIDADGRVAFFSTLVGAHVDNDNDLALWATDGNGSLRLLAREGETSADPVSGMRIIRLDGAAISGGGHVLYSADVMNSAGQAGTALFLWHPDRGTLFVTGSGDALKTSGSKKKVVKSVDFSAGSGGQDGRAMSISPSGVVTFRATFADNSQGVYLANLPAGLSDLANQSSQPFSDGRVTSADLKLFLKAYAQGRPIADVAGDDEPGGDGVVDAQDLAAFMADYQSQNP